MTIESESKVRAKRQHVGECFDVLFVLIFGAFSETLTNTLNAS